MEEIKSKGREQVKVKRNKLNISQEELAFKSGLDRTYITSVEKCGRNISIINIEKIFNRILEENKQEEFYKRLKIFLNMYMKMICI